MEIKRNETEEFALVTVVQGVREIPVTESKSWCPDL